MLRNYATLDEIIEKLTKLREEHGGHINVDLGYEHDQGFPQETSAFNVVFKDNTIVIHGLEWLNSQERTLVEQIIQEEQKRVMHMFPPHLCVPWFKENFSVGEKVAFMYDGGMGGVYPIIGKIETMDAPILVVNGRHWTMGDVVRIGKLI